MTTGLVTISDVPANPIAIAAKRDNFESDTEFLEYIAEREKVRPETRQAYIETYHQTVSQGETPFIPYFVRPHLEDLLGPEHALNPPKEKLQVAAARPRIKKPRKKKHRRLVGRRNPKH